MTSCHSLYLKTLYTIPLWFRVCSEFGGFSLFLCSLIYLFREYLLSIYSVLVSLIGTWGLYSQRKRWQKISKLTELQKYQSKVRNRERLGQGAGLHRGQGRHLRKEGTEQPEWSEGQTMQNLGREHFKQKEEQVQRSWDEMLNSPGKGQGGWSS